MKILLFIYLGLMIGTTIGFKFTGFNRPKNLRKFIPCAVESWTGSLGRTYKCSWVWSELGEEEER